MTDAPNRIRELRLEARLSQQALADRIGCSKMHVSAIERGKQGLSLRVMQRFADALNVPVVDIFSLKDNPVALSAAERRLIAQMRQAPPETVEKFLKIVDIIAPREPVPE